MVYLLFSCLDLVFSQTGKCILHVLGKKIEHKRFLHVLQAEEYNKAAVIFEPENWVQNCYARIHQQISEKLVGNLTLIFRYVVDRRKRKKMIPKKYRHTVRFFELEALEETPICV